MVFCYTIYGLTDLRIHPPPSPSRGPAVRRASTNQVGAGSIMGAMARSAVARAQNPGGHSDSDRDFVRSGRSSAPRSARASCAPRTPPCARLSGACRAGAWAGWRCAAPRRRVFQQRLELASQRLGALRVVRVARSLRPSLGFTNARGVFPFERLREPLFSELVPVALLPRRRANRLGAQVEQLLHHERRRDGEIERRRVFHTGWVVG